MNIGDKLPQILGTDADHVITDIITKVDTKNAAQQLINLLNNK